MLHTSLKTSDDLQNAMLTGIQRVGGGARTALSQAGIELYPGASGDADQAVEALLNGSLDYDPNTMCSHHHEGGEHNCHGHGHSCGGHN